MLRNKSPRFRNFRFSFVGQLLIVQPSSYVVLILYLIYLLVKENCQKEQTFTCLLRLWSVPFCDLCIPTRSHMLSCWDLIPTCQKFNSVLFTSHQRVKAWILVLEILLAAFTPSPSHISQCFDLKSNSFACPKSNLVYVGDPSDLRNTKLALEKQRTPENAAKVTAI